MKAWCHKCNKPVDEVIKIVYDYQHSYKYAVKCHGETQEQDLPALILIGIKDIGSIQIDAFQERVSLPLQQLEEK